MLRDIGVDWRDRKLRSKSYMGQTAVVRTDGWKTLPVASIVGRGTRSLRWGLG